MKLLKGLFGLAAIFVLGVLIVAFFFERIEPSEIGVKQSLWGGSGVMSEDFYAGYHWGVAGYHKWHRLDGRTHFLTFSVSKGQSGSSRRHRNAQEERPLEIRTRDNDPVSVDVTITYRIIRGEAHLIVAEGLQDRYMERVASKVKDVLRGELSKLIPGDFVNTDKRLEQADNIMPLLGISLAAYHVEPQSIMIRAVRFLPEYEAKLQVTQLTSQEAQLEKAKRRVSDAEKITESFSKETEAFEKQARAEWDKKLQEASSNNGVLVAEILAAANIYDNKTRPNADANYETLVADGKLAVDKAEALRDELRNAALDSVGGRILQARQAAENLNFESVTLNSNDPSVPTIIEIDKLVDLLIGEELPAGKSGNE